jgi:hypothetical protein
MIRLLFIGHFWRISSGTSALAIVELKLCRSEWNDSRETLRPSLPSFFSSYSVVDASAFHQSFERHAESRFSGSRLIEQLAENCFLFAGHDPTAIFHSAGLQKVSGEVPQEIGRKPELFTTSLRLAARDRFTRS